MTCCVIHGAAFSIFLGATASFFLRPNSALVTSIHRSGRIRSRSSSSAAFVFVIDSAVADFWRLGAAVPHIMIGILVDDSSFQFQWHLYLWIGEESKLAIVRKRLESADRLIASNARACASCWSLPVRIDKAKCLTLTHVCLDLFSSLRMYKDSKMRMR